MAEEKPKRSRKKTIKSTSTKTPALSPKNPLTPLNTKSAKPTTKKAASSKQTKAAIPPQKQASPYLKIGVIVFCASLVVGLVGFGISLLMTPEPVVLIKDRLVRVVCNRPLVKDAVYNIGFSRCDITTLPLVPKRELTKKEKKALIKTLDAADLIVFDHIETTLTHYPFLKTYISDPRLAILSNELSDDDYHFTKPNTPNPHFYLSPLLWKLAIDLIYDRLCTLDETHTDTYLNYYTLYGYKLDALDAAIKLNIATIPKHQRVFSSLSSSYTYFCDTYGLLVNPVKILNTMPSNPTENARLTAKNLGQKRIRALFYNPAELSSDAHKTLRIMIDGRYAKRLDVIPLSVALEDEHNLQETYLGMMVYYMRHITKKLKR